MWIHSRVYFCYVRLGPRGCAKWDADDVVEIPPIEEVMSIRSCSTLICMRFSWASVQGADAYLCMYIFFS